MAHTRTDLKALPTRIDRYPAKMIAHLASTLVERFAMDAAHLVDPFCGSGAVLRAGSLRRLRVTGIDINPFGVLLTGVKLQGFDRKRAQQLAAEFLDGTNGMQELPVSWDKKDYWFTNSTLRKYERLRHRAVEMKLSSSRAGRAVLLAFGLSVRQCSRADQRSPKPFISKHARESRSGKHYDPTIIISRLLDELSDLYGILTGVEADVFHLDIGDKGAIRKRVSCCTHIITSPPYVNAQDYFRNSKLELYLLEGILPFRIGDIIHRFIGTERGLSGAVLCGTSAESRRKLVPELEFLEKHRRDQAVVLHRYLDDMQTAFDTIRMLFSPGGTLVIVGGDNLIGGKRIPTWRVLNKMLEDLGFLLVESFGDRIRNRALAPKRCGHKGMIKEEIVSAFRLPSSRSRPNVR